MKNTLTTTVFCTFLLCSCSKKVFENHISKVENSNKNVTTKTDNDPVLAKIATHKVSKFVVDSVRFEKKYKISQNISVDFDETVLLFNCLENSVLDSIYNGSTSTKRVNFSDFTKSGVLKSLEKEANIFVKESKDDFIGEPKFQQDWFINSNIRIFDEVDDFLILKAQSSGLTGGVHGFDDENFIVVDTKNQKKINLNDFMNVSKVNWNQVLLNSIGRLSEQLTDKNELTYSQNFYFTKEKLVFSYRQGQIAPYTMEIIEIPVNFSEISDALNPEFKQRMGIK